MREAHPRIEAMGGGALAVATGADFQARQLMADGVPFPCLVDPDKNLYRALDLPRIRPSQFLRPRTWANYLGAMSARRARQGRPAGDTLQAPGVVIVDQERTVRYLHRGVTVGDYPPLEEALTALAAITTT